MGIEEVAQKCPECLFKVPISVKNGPTNEQLVKLAKDLGLEGDLVQDCVDNVKALYQVFDKCDSTMVEINPLGVIETPTDEKVICCLDAKTPSTRTRLPPEGDLRSARQGDRHCAH